MELENTGDDPIALLTSLRQTVVDLLASWSSDSDDLADIKDAESKFKLKDVAGILQFIPLLVQDESYKFLADLVADLVTEHGDSVQAFFSKEPKTAAPDEAVIELKKWRLKLVTELKSFIKTIDICIVTSILEKSDALSPKPDLILLVMGPAGAGKSCFIRNAVGTSYVETEKTPSQEAVGIDVHSVSLDGRKVALIDTPGFDDDSEKNNDRFHNIARWLEYSNDAERHVHGILYLTPITSIDQKGFLNLELFARLVGQSSFPKVVIVSTMWDTLQSRVTGVFREQTRIQGLWNDFTMNGSGFARSFGDKSSALAIVSNAMSDIEIAKATTVLRIQSEMTREKGRENLDETTAGKHLKFKTDGYVKPAPNRSLFRFAFLSPIPIAAWGYIHHHIGLVSYCIILFVSANMYSAAIPVYKEVARPELQPGYTRIEWTCSCGDVLTADMKQHSQGSLARLANRLEGKIIGHSPMLKKAAENTEKTSSDNSTPTQVPSASSSNVDASNVSAAVSKISNNIRNLARTISKDDTSAVIRRFAAKFQWLELCIRQSQLTHSLVELDIAGPHTDRTVFQKIRESYESNRRPMKLGPWRTRRSKGGLFVEFRKDKLASSTSKATVSIMKRGCVPSQKEANEYQYSFNPIPMDEPPMPAETFHHYFSKPHDAEDLATWITRFPMLTGSSLNFDNNRLAKGWGIEIIEERDWTIFAFANALMVVLSGAAALIYARTTGDTQTAVALGAWLTAIQALIFNPVLYIWTDG